jgi:hypothetical protein
VANCTWGTWEDMTPGSPHTCADGITKNTGAGAEFQSGDDKTAAEMSIQVSYGTNANAAIQIWVSRMEDLAGTHEQTSGVRFRLPVAANTTFHKVISATMLGGCVREIWIYNPSGSTITYSAWVRYMEVSGN